MTNVSVIPNSFGVPPVSTGTNINTAFGAVEPVQAYDRLGRKSAQYARIPDICPKGDIHPLYLQLCCRISTYALSGDGCLNHPNPRTRLYVQIGRYLPRKVFRKFYRLPRSTWERLEQAWIANMLTLLLNNSIDLSKLDKELICSIQHYKLWFIRFALNRVTLVRKKFRPGKPRSRFSRFRAYCPDLDKLISGLKALSAWMQFASLSEDDRNTKPKSLVWFKGWLSAQGRPTLPWYPKTGVYRKWRYILTGVPLTEMDIHQLCQMRSFGRALPCPSHEMCEKGLQETLEVLTGPHDPLSEDKLLIVYRFSSMFWERVGAKETPTATHVSVSTSACLERTTAEGGTASYWRDHLRNAENTTWYYTEIPPVKDKYLDAYRFGGPRPFGPSEGRSPWVDYQPVHQYVDCWQRVAMDLRHLGTTDYYGAADWWKRPVQSFYRSYFDYRKIYDEREHLMMFGSLDPEGLIDCEVGQFFLLIASGEALAHGRFWPPPDIVIESDDGLIRLPLWRADRFESVWDNTSAISYTPYDRPECAIMALSEPGGKVRPLTKNASWLNLILKSMRFMIEPIVARDGRGRIGLRHLNKMWSFLKYLGGTGRSSIGQIAQSVDYTASTDYISLDLIKSIWGGLSDLIPKRHPFRVFMELIWFPRKITLDKKFSYLPEPGNHTCGSFMGEPLSFITLTVLNLLIEEITYSYYVTCRPPWSGTPYGDLFYEEHGYNTRDVRFHRRPPPCGVCGDDVVAVRTDFRHAELFRTIAKDLGMKLSVGKDGVSRRLMIFAEDHVLLSSTGKFVYLDVIKARLLTTASRQHADNRSSLLGKGRMLTNQLDYLDDAKFSVRVTEIYTYLKVLTFKGMFRDRFVPWELPPVLSGVGIPCSSVSKETKRKIWIINDKLNEEPRDYRFFLELMDINNYRKYGSDTEESMFPILCREMGRLRPYSGDIPDFDPENPGNLTSVIFTEKQVIDYLSMKGCELPPNPFGGKVERDILDDEARRLGIVPIGDLIDRYKRGFLFNNFLLKDVVRQVMSVNDYRRRVCLFWTCIWKNPDFKRKYYRKKIPTNLPSINEVERKVRSIAFGYVTDTRVSPGKSGALVDPVRSLPRMSVPGKISRLPKLGE